MGCDGHWRGVVVSLAAAAFAFWQARTAPGARDAAVAQADTTREMMELERAKHHEATAPTFVLTIIPADEEYVAAVAVTMTAGPPAIEVEISYLNGWTRPSGSGEVERREVPGRTMHRRQMIKNARTSFGHSAPRDAEQIWSKVSITSFAFDDPERRWEHVERLDWRKPPRAVNDV